MRKYAEYNEGFFAEKSLEACYYAGLIAADGSVSNSGVISISLKIEDKGQLEKLRMALNGNPVRETWQTLPSTNKSYCRADFSAGSVKMAKDLAEVYNIHPRKSLTHTPPQGLSTEQELAFIAGYIDGDGCYTFNPSRRPVLNILGTEEFLRWALSVLGVDGTIRSRGNISEVTVTGDKAIRARSKYICMDLPFLPRKYKLWEGLELNMEILNGSQPKLKTCTHGTTRMYCHYKCRCDPCKLAMSEYGKKRRSGVK